MNITIVKMAASAVCGVVVGSAATFFILRSKMIRECEAEIEAAWEDADEHYREVYRKKLAAKEKAEMNRKAKEQAEIHEKTAEKHEKVSVCPKPKQTPEEKERKFDVKSFRKKASEKVQSYRRNVFTDPPSQHDIQLAKDGYETDDEYDYYFDELEEVNDSPKEGLREDPYVISADQFANEHTYWDKITVYVYLDGNVIDESGEVVDDIDACVGKDTMERLEELADESGTILVRNEMRSTDYELLLMDETYIPDTAPVRED